MSKSGATGKRKELLDKLLKDNELLRKMRDLKQEDTEEYKSKEKEIQEIAKSIAEDFMNGVELPGVSVTTESELKKGGKKKRGKKKVDQIAEKFYKISKGEGGSGEGSDDQENGEDSNEETGNTSFDDVDSEDDCVDDVSGTETGSTAEDDSDDSDSGSGSGSGSEDDSGSEDSLEIESDRVKKIAEKLKKLIKG